MLHARPSALYSLFVLLLVSAPTGVRGFQSDRIIGLTTAGGKANTKDLVVRRPPIVDGAVTTAGSQFSAVGSWTEKGYFNGAYTYTVNVKASGRWTSSSKQAKETLVVSISKFKDVPINGTWQFESAGTCPVDPWRFPVTCTGIQRSVKRSPSGPTDGLTHAVPFPMSAAGRLTAGEINAVSLAEVALPQSNQTLTNPQQVQVKVLVHGATIADTSGSLKVEVRPQGAGDFPSAAQSGEYFTRSSPTYVGSTTTVSFDMSGHNHTDWQVAGTFTKNSQIGSRSSWVHFRLKPKVMYKPVAIQNIEGESLAATASQPVTAQPMQAFGSSWSGGAHLLWAPSGVGQTLAVTFDVPATRTYAAELYMTRAPDFGDVRVTISTLTPTLQFYGFSPKVASSGPIQMGKFLLNEGPHTLAFHVTGRYKDSKGYRVGFDRVRLYPQ